MKKSLIVAIQVSVALVASFSSCLAQNTPADPSEDNRQTVAFLLFDNYETLDVFGPAEIFGRLVSQYELKFYSLEGGPINNRHGVQIVTEKLKGDVPAPHILLVPGGLGTRREVDNEVLLDWIRFLSGGSDYVLSVCTGSALLARAGLLDGREATSNKRAFSWVVTNSDAVQWDSQARWKIDGKYYTSSGVSAGMDMSLGFLADRHGLEFARKVAKEIEYVWIEDKDHDQFKAQ
ncbi:MAG: DJ-1/PfpI family protein [Bacteroidota bacterium]